MAGFKPRKTNCRNRRDHNCSPCPYCGVTEHDWDERSGLCRVCEQRDVGLSEWMDYYEDGKAGGGRRINRKRKFDDDEDN